MVSENIFNRIFRLDEKSRIALFHDLNIDFDSSDMSTKEALSRAITTKFGNDRELFEKLELNLIYFELYPKLTSISKDDLKFFFPLRLRNKITSKITKDELLSFLKESIVNKSITIQQINQKISSYSVVSKVKMINDKNELTSLSLFLWREPLEELDKDKIIKKLITDLEYGKLSPEKIESYLKDKSLTIKDKSKKAKSGNFDDLIKEIKTLSTQILLMETKIEKQEQRLVELDNNINNKIKNLESNINFLVSRFDDIDKNSHIGDTEKLLVALRKESLNLTSLKENSFNSLFKSLNKENISDMEFLKNGFAVIVMDCLLKVTKEIDWEVSLDSFYRILSEEILSLKGSKSAISEIPIIRNIVCKRMGLSPEKFDSLLFDCFENNWVALEVGTPIGEKDAKWLDTGKNRYYYVKLKR